MILGSSTIPGTNRIRSQLDQTDDPEDRKVIRDRIKELRAQKAAKKSKYKPPVVCLWNND